MWTAHKHSKSRARNRAHLSRVVLLSIYPKRLYLPTTYTENFVVSKAFFAALPANNCASTIPAAQISRPGVRVELSSHCSGVMSACQVEACPAPTLGFYICTVVANRKTKVKVSQGQSERIRTVWTVTEQQHVGGLDILIHKERREGTFLRA